MRLLSDIVNALSRLPDYKMFTLLALWIPFKLLKITLFAFTFAFYAFHYCLGPAYHGQEALPLKLYLVKITKGAHMNPLP